MRNAGGGAVRFRPDTKSGRGGGGGGGGRGVLPASVPIQKAGEGGVARFSPDTKSWGRGCCPLQARYEKRGGGGGVGSVTTKIILPKIYPRIKFRCQKVSHGIDIFS